MSYAPQGENGLDDDDIGPTFKGHRIEKKGCPKMPMTNYQ